MGRRIHVISFQVPYPADSGGVIDVYYKLKALKDAGCNVVLHSFAYGGRNATPMLRAVADEIYLYKRDTNPLNLLSATPYIVKSRSSKELLARLMLDDAPILFEGVHTTAILASPALRNRKKYIRTHNVEGDYYAALATASTSFVKKLYYLWEARKLRYYEKRLAAADAIFSITDKDRNFFAQLYPAKKVELLPCFHNGACDNIDRSNVGSGDYILYNGNLAVEENAKAVRYLMEDIAPLLPDVNWVIAGANPDAGLRRCISSVPNAVLKASPSEKEMLDLITKAAANVLVTFQSTGIKLKLLNALYRGGWCIVNEEMVEGTPLREACMVAATKQDFVAAVKKALSHKITNDVLTKRDTLLRRYYDNDVNIKVLLPYI